MTRPCGHWGDKALTGAGSSDLSERTQRDENTQRVLGFRARPPVHIVCRKSIFKLVLTMNLTQLANDEPLDLFGVPFQLRVSLDNFCQLRPGIRSPDTALHCDLPDRPGERMVLDSDQCLNEGPLEAQIV